MSASAFSLRPFSGDSDLRLLVDFAGHRLAQRWPRATCWHPGDILWQLYQATPLPEVEDIRLWFAGDRLAGFAAFEAPLRFQFDIAAGDEQSSELLGEITAWAEARRRAVARPDEAIPIAYAALGSDTVATSVLDSDTGRVAMLEAMGYRRTSATETRFALSLSALPPNRDVPNGYRARHAAAADIEQRAELHRDAWSVWGTSGFTAGAYVRLRRAPLYDETLDVVTEAPGGRLVSYCLCWLDEESRVATLEPVGTRPSYAGRGLARFTILSALHRARERGAKTALVSTAGVNTQAQALYRRCGFEVVDGEHFFAKRLNR